MRDAILASRQRIVDNRAMVGLDLDLALPMPISDSRSKPRYPELIDAIRNCEFRTLLAEIEKEAGVSASTAPAPAHQQGELF